jgi:hypothetical protein
MRKLLCVGGSHAGEVISVHPNEEYVCLHERVDLTALDYLILGTGGMPEPKPLGEKTIYRVERLISGNKEFEVLYIKDGKDLVGDLINGYRPQVAKRFIR